MAQLTLNLTQDDIDHPTPASLWTLQSFMLWPESEDARKTWFGAQIVKFGEDRIDQLPLGVARASFRAALNPARVEDLADDASERRVLGTALGRIVCEVLFTELTLTESRRKLVEDMYPTADREGIKMGESSIVNKNGKLAPFRPVAHLWAASFYIRIRDATLIREVPCRVSQVGRFIGFAERLRATAEVAHSAHTHHPVMRPGEAIRLPKGLRIPQVLPSVS